MLPSATYSAPPLLHPPHPALPLLAHRTDAIAGHGGSARCYHRRRHRSRRPALRVDIRHTMSRCHPPHILLVRSARCCCYTTATVSTPPPSSPHAPLPSQPLCSHKVPSIATSAWSESGRDPAWPWIRWVQRAATTDATAHVAPLCHHESICVTAAASYPAHPIAGHGGSARCYHRRRHCSCRPALPP